MQKGILHYYCLIINSARVAVHVSLKAENIPSHSLIQTHGNPDVNTEEDINTPP